VFIFIYVLSFSFTKVSEETKAAQTVLNTTSIACH